MNLLPADPRLSWRGAVSLEHGDGWIQPWRVPFADRALFEAGLRAKASWPAGIRLAFKTDATAISGVAESVAGREGFSPSIDLVIAGETAGAQSLVEGPAFRFEDLPAGEKAVELWLPHFATFRLRELELHGGSYCAGAEDTSSRWITYGSSITHCRTAASPARTWPAIVARKAGLNLTCLGFGGDCHLDPLIARTMRDLPADFLSIKVGINIYGAGSLGRRTFAPGIIAFVQLVREKHPNTPFAVISPIVSPPREATPNRVGLTLADMRVEVASAVETLRAHGDRNVHYVDGLALFGSEYLDWLPDNVHPDAHGYELLARNFLREVVDTHFSGDDHKRC